MLNYLAEYAVRISAVLVFVPVIGFYGIVVSYYASNIFGNCMRLVKTFRITGLSPDWKELLVYPLFGAAAAFYLPYTLFHFTGTEINGSLPLSAVYIFLAGVIYITVSSMLQGSYYNIRKGKFNNTAENFK